MEANWVYFALVLICCVVLIVLVILKNQKDKKDLISSVNAQEDTHKHSEREKNVD